MFVAVGGLFKYKQSLYRVLKSSSCNKCAFCDNDECINLRERGLLPECGVGRRVDKKSVVFVAEFNISQDIVDLD